MNMLDIVSLKTKNRTRKEEILFNILLCLNVHGKYNLYEEVTEHSIVRASQILFKSDINNFIKYFSSKTDHNLSKLTKSELFGFYDAQAGAISILEEYEKKISSPSHFLVRAIDGDAFLLMLSIININATLEDKSIAGYNDFIKHYADREGFLKARKAEEIGYLNRAIHTERTKLDSNKIEIERLKQCAREEEIKWNGYISEIRNLGYPYEKNIEGYKKWAKMHIDNFGLSLHGVQLTYTDLCSLHIDPLISEK
jgi:hypothetical protein